MPFKHLRCPENYQVQQLRSYDAIGNPLTYDGYTYTWEQGRQLAGMSGNGKTITYKDNDADKII